MTRIIHIAGNAGSGKSLLALNLGIALTHHGKDVTLVDSNIYSPDISNYIDISPEIFLNEYLLGERAIEETIHYHPSGMKVIASTVETEHNPEFHERINQALLSLHGKSEIVLVDSFSHNPAYFSILNNADETLFITNDDFPSIVKTKDFIRTMEEKGINVIGVVLNKRRKSKDKKHIEAILDKPILAEIDYDPSLVESVNQRTPAYIHYPKSNMSKAVDELAKLLRL